ncbi:unnamed protein product, partial [marine sediment metagenome]
GVIGIDGKEYPIPTQEQVVELFDHNRELVGRKVPQGFTCQGTVLLTHFKNIYLPY